MPIRLSSDIMRARSGSNGLSLETARRIIAIANPRPQYPNDHHQGEGRQPQKRWFGATSSRPASHQIAHFTPCSSPELDAMLSRIRNDVILPAYLPDHQRRRLYQARYANALRHDPIIIELDGESIRFRYRDPSTMPNPARLTMAAVARFRSPDDFENLRPLLEGLHIADYRLQAHLWAKIQRLAGTHGQILKMLDLARSVEVTGYALDNSEKANEMLHFLQLKAVPTGEHAHKLEWSFDATRKALRHAEMVVEMLATSGHRRNKGALRYGSPDLPLPGDPQVLTAPLHMAAALVVKTPAKHEEHADREKAEALETVKKLGAEIVKTWPGDTRFLRLHPKEAYEDELNLMYLMDPGKFLTLMTPLAHGLDLAVTALEKEDPGLAGQLGRRRKLLEEDLVEMREKSKEKSKEKGEGVHQRSEDVHRRLYGP